MEALDDFRRMREAFVGGLADRLQGVDTEHRTLAFEECHAACEVDDEEEHRRLFEDLVDLSPAPPHQLSTLTVGPCSVTA
jgi:hypothetical protein